MKSALFALLSFALFLTPFPALAASDEPSRVAQAFYDAYLKTANAQGNTKKQVMNSGALTPGLKKAYAAYMKQPDMDPILNAQDFPKTGFQASAASIKGDAATVTMSSRDPSFPSTFKVVLTKSAQGWQISRIADLKEK